MILTDLLERSADARADAVAVVYRSERLTYGDLRRRVHGVEGRLAGEGVAPGDRVALVTGNHAGFVVALMGILSRGATAVPVNAQYRMQELRTVFESTRPAALVVDPDRLDLVTESAAICGAPPILEVGERGGFEEADPPTAPAAVRGSDAALCQFSSGTTGRPKRVVRTHAQLMAELDALHHRIGTTADDVILGSIPLFHSHGLCNAVLAALRCGGRLILTGGFYARSILHLIESEGITLWPTVPLMVRILVEMPGPPRRELSTLRLVFSAGAPLDPDVARRFGARYGPVVRQLYGCTEMGAITLDDGSEPGTETSVGTPLPGNRVRILAPDGTELPAGEVGRVAVCGPGLAAGYEDEDERSAAAFAGGEFQPGDLGRLDEAGCLTLTGREQLFINVGGNKVDPEEVERVLRSHPDVADVAVTRGTHAYYGEIVRAFVVPNVGATPSERVLRRHCRDLLADYKVPKEVVLRDRIPRSPTGKVLRKYLEDEGLEG